MTSPVVDAASADTPEQTAIAEVLEFIMVTLMLHERSIASPMAITRPENLPTAEELRRQCSTSDVSGGDGAASSNSNEEMYTLVLWNDEGHSFDQVISKVMECRHCDHDEAYQVAVEVSSILFLNTHTYAFILIANDE